MENRIATRMAVEVRKDNGTSKISGYAAVFYRNGERETEYEMFPGLVERVAPVAFNRAIAEGQNVRGLVNHDPNQVLGRVPKTMRLSVDEVGLRYEIDLPDTQLGRDLTVLLERDDIAGSSFSFGIRKQSRERLPDGTEVRTLEDVDLYDVGPVTFPAYEATTADRRSELQADVEKRKIAWAAHEERQRKVASYGLSVDEDGD